VTKVYQGRQEQERDEADAVAHGWRVVSRDSGRRGYTVTYELASAYGSTTQPARRSGIRAISWLFLLWNLVTLGLIAWRLATGGYLSGTLQETLDLVLQSRIVLGLIVAWLIGVLVLGLLWLRGRTTD
jgi:hypothetical protein